jgi:iron(III) transport system permease protein
MRRSAAAAAWLAAFAVCAGDLGHSLLVIPPGMETIQRRIFGLVHSGVEEQVAGVCLIMFAFYLALAVCVAGLLARSGQEVGVYTE